MKFLVDAYIPPGVADHLRTAGHDAIHTRDLACKNETPDRIINEISIQETRVVISKDTDFYYSHLLNQRPHKLVLVRTGNIRSRELIALFEAHLPEIVQALEESSLVELDRSSVRVVI